MGTSITIVQADEYVAMYLVFAGSVVFEYVCEEMTTPTIETSTPDKPER